jgi:hypothetical protein
MKSTLTLSATALIIILFSCRHDAVDSPRPQNIPKLKRIVAKDSTGRITATTTYNDRELVVADSAFSSNGTPTVWTAWEYNSKGKRTKYTMWVPSITSPGYHWMDVDEYRDDTIPVTYRHYLHGSQTLLTKHIYNASNQLVLDSNFHTAITPPASSIYKWTYTYDAQGRLLTHTRFNDLNDSVSQSTYSYATNHKEVMSIGFQYNPYSRSSSLTVTDYSPSGRILSEKTYTGLNQLFSQTDYAYTFDANNNLLKTVKTDISGNTWESRFTNNSFGKPDIEERFYRNKPAATIYYYYE